MDAVGEDGHVFGLSPPQQILARTRTVCETAGAHRSGSSLDRSDPMGQAAPGLARGTEMNREGAAGREVRQRLDHVAQGTELMLDRLPSGRNKATLVVALGIDAARKRCDKADEAIAAHEDGGFGARAAILAEAEHFTVERRN